MFIAHSAYVHYRAIDRFSRAPIWRRASAVGQGRPGKKAGAYTPHGPCPDKGPGPEGSGSAHCPISRCVDQNGPPGITPRVGSNSSNNLLDALRQRVLLKRAKMLRIRAFERRKPVIGVSSGGAALARAWCRVRNALLDHLISAQQNRWGYRKAERPGDLEVHGHLKFCILVAARRGRGNSQSKRSRSSPRPCLAYATVAGSDPGIWCHHSTA